MAAPVWEVYFQLVDYSSTTVSSANAQKELRGQLVFLSEASAPVFFFPSVEKTQAHNEPAI